MSLLDPIWMGLFAVIGAQKAMNADLNPLAAMLIGCVTAFGGGILRDLLSYEMPELVKPGPINYLAAILGSILYVMLVKGAHVDKVASEWVTIVFVFGLRMLSLKFGIRAPQPVDLPAKLPGTAAARRAPAPTSGARLRARRRPATPGSSGRCRRGSTASRRAARRPRRTRATEPRRADPALP